MEKDIQIILYRRLNVLRGGGRTEREIY